MRSCQEKSDYPGTGIRVLNIEACMYGTSLIAEALQSQNNEHDFYKNSINRKLLVLHCQSLINDTEFLTCGRGIVLNLDLVSKFAATREQSTPVI